MNTTYRSTIRWRTGVLALESCIVLGFVGIACAAPQVTSPPRIFVDDVCGPRCVQFILAHYGQEVELATLVRETQYPERERGATLEALQQALESRDVETYALQAEPGARLVWKDPVLLHMHNAGPAGGHYVVLLPGSSSGTARIADGLQGSSERPWTEVEREMSGYALLTSREPIAAPAGAVTSAADPDRWFTFAGLAILSLVIAAGVGRFVWFPSSARPARAPFRKGEPDHV